MKVENKGEEMEGLSFGRKESLVLDRKEVALGFLRDE